MNKILLMITVFSLGYVANDILREMNVSPIGNVNAEVGGRDLDYYDLIGNRDFAKSVKSVVTGKCYVYGEKDALGTYSIICSGS